MTHETLELLHRCYQEALMQSSNILEIVENLYKILSNAEIPSEDLQAFDSFYDGLRHCLQYRRKTISITNMITCFSITLVCIIHWLIDFHKLQIDITIFAGRKSLESDLTKILTKAESNLSIILRDRFRLRGVLSKDCSLDLEVIYVIFDAITGIIAGKNRRMQEDFTNWYENTNKISKLDKLIIKQILDIPFSIDFLKDYIKNPKEKGYQTLQFTLSIPMYSQTLPGCQFEVQLRTHEMHAMAIDDDYKKPKTEHEKRIQDVFTDDKLKIADFTGPTSPEDDSDGLYSQKLVLNRRISPTLVPSI